MYPKDVVKESSLVVKETLGDLRRLCISTLDTGNAGQDHRESISPKSPKPEFRVQGLGFRSIS